MASESRGKTNRHSTITFTLPLSCQICLGKVKQPVLCPNHHVFCQLCMDIWLEKNKQCPTCRVEINDSNPVKNIIGGQLEDEDVKRQSSTELRRARFELLYKEYEDQFDQMRKESIILRTENNILLAQLQDAEDKNDEHKAEKDPSAKNEPNLLMLTKNLQEAQTLYTGIKEEMNQLKQENSKLKDENVNLTRENENLRLEIAQRSPKKFGRYTVATLETKLSEYEKEIRQLKKALERSDEYIEDLEKQIEKLSQSRHETEHFNKRKQIPISKEVLHSEMNGNIYTNGNEITASDTEDYGEIKSALVHFKQEPSLCQDRNAAKRILFSLSASSEDKVNDKTRPIASKSDSENYDNEQTESVKYPDSIMKRGEGGKSHKQCNGKVPDVHERVSKNKRVHFNVPKSASISSSFDLEMPSPYGKGKQSLSRQLGTGNSKSGRDRGLDDLNESTDEVDGDPSSDFDKHVVSLLKKANASSYNSSVHSIKLVNSGGLNSDNEFSHISKSKKSYPNSHYEDSNDSSRLSMPDFDSPRKSPSLDSDGLSDSPRKPGLLQGDEIDFDDEEYDRTNQKNPSRTELDISMTPEMSDCLRLMNQAERKLEMPPSSIPYSDRGVNSISSSRSDPVSFHLTSSYNGNARGIPAAYNYNSSIVPKHPVQSFSSSESLRSWEKDFFRGLQANPYKQYKVNNPLPSHVSIPSDSNNNLHGNTVDTGIPFSQKNMSLVSHIDDFTNPKTSAVSDSANSKSFALTNTSNLSHVYSASANKYGGGISSNSNPLSLYSDKPPSVTSQIPFSLSSADHPYTTVGSNHNQIDRRLDIPPPPSSSASALSSYSLSNNSSNYLTSSSTTKDHHHAHHSSSSGPPIISKTNSSQAFRNPLPPSLNNSSLQWPDSPVKNLIVSEPSSSDLGNSSDLLRSSGRDRNRPTFMTSPRSVQKHGQDFIYTSSASSFSSDVNNSSFLPEPKKRLFAIDDDLDLSMPSKTAKK